MLYFKDEIHQTPLQELTVFPRLAAGA